jgi:hypothetical protein
MKLPTRSRQHKAESDSLDLVKYKLGKKLGIIRSQGENDYGIDLEIELVKGSKVTGRFVKVQVKSSEDLRLRKNGTPAISGIKQSTLAYWCELSFRAGVIAYAVDLATETIYVTKDLFWQASQRIDGSEKSKTIEFLPAGEDSIALAFVATAVEGFRPSMAEIVSAHTLALRRLKVFLELLGAAYHFDAGSDLHEPDHFRDLLQVCSVLLWGAGERLWTEKRDQRGWTSYDYWKDKSEQDGWDGISYFAAQPILSTLVPEMVRVLRTYRERVLAGKYYWAHKNPSYLALVYETTVPEADGKDELILWGQEYDQRGSVVVGSGAYFAEQARAPAEKKTRRRK